MKSCWFFSIKSCEGTKSSEPLCTLLSSLVEDGQLFIYLFNIEQSFKKKKKETVHWNQRAEVIFPVLLQPSNA